MAKASYGFRSRAQLRALRLAGLVAVLESCTDPTFVPADAAAPMREERQDAAPDEHDADGPPDNEPVVPDAGGENGSSDAQVRVDAASEDASSAPSDGGQPMTVSNDAGAAAGLPSWALGLVGTYAKRSVTFSYEDEVSPPTNTLNVEHSLVKIAKSNDELRVTVQPCDYTVALPTSPNLPVIFKHPDRFPPLTGLILLGENNTFSTPEPMVSHLGFEPSRGKDCVAGRHQAYEDQPWITGGSCQCYAGVLPSTQSDCRVSDTDRDNRSGITMRNPGAISGTYSDVSIVFDYAVTFAAGELKPGKRVELTETRTQTQACINAAVDFCAVGNNQLCPGGTTKLIRLSEQVTDVGCEAVDKGAFGPVDNWPAAVDCRAK